MNSLWNLTSIPEYEQTNDLTSEIQKITKEISNKKEQFIKKTLLEKCPLDECHCKVRTAKWMTEYTNPSGIHEILILMCDAGHEWHKKLTIEFKIYIASTEYEANIK